MSSMLIPPQSENYKNASNIIREDSMMLSSPSLWPDKVSMFYTPTHTYTNSKTVSRRTCPWSGYIKGASGACPEWLQHDQPKHTHTTYTLPQPRIMMSSKLGSSSITKGSLTCWHRRQATDRHSQLRLRGRHKEFNTQHVSGQSLYSQTVKPSHTHTHTLSLSLSRTHTHTEPTKSIDKYNRYKQWRGYMRFADKRIKLWPSRGYNKYKTGHRLQSVL